MRIVRYQNAAGPAVGLDDAGTLRALPVGSIAELLSLTLDDLRKLVEGTDLGEVHAGPPQLLAPVDGLTEVWASGVTYQRSRAARVEESRAADVYDLVYEAPRPELFFKSAAWRVVGDGDPIGIREDSELNVPEPELAVVVNRHGAIVGATICNDVSSRSIEGVNPLYLPQAKIYAGACALGPAITPAWQLDLAALPVSCVVTRAGQPVWQGQTSTALMRRGFEELVDYLYRANHFPHGAVLSTGTGIVPDMDFTLRDGDVVTIDIAGIGLLTNTVRTGKSAFEGGTR
jgi:2-dehydro-3-deoxy-D-arabinonate dehydratase